MENNFIKINHGINNWKRYLGSFFAFFGSIILGTFVYGFLMTLYVKRDGDPNTYYDNKEMIFVNADPLYDFVMGNLVYVVWIIGIFIFIKVIHKRRFMTLITPNEKINWNRVFFGFGIFFVFMAGTNLIDFLLNPSDYSLNDIKFSDFLKLILFVLILTPIQTTAEEVFFRGYLMQWVGRKIHHPLLLSVIVGLIFALPHFVNPEMSHSFFFIGSDYVLTGILWCYVTARTNSLELTIGAHAANNMFLGWFVVIEHSVSGNIPSLFVIKNLDPKMSLLWTIIILSAFTYFSIKKFGTKNSEIVQMDQPINS